MKSNTHNIPFNMHFYIPIFSVFAQTLIFDYSQAQTISVQVTNGTLLGSWSEGVAKFSGIPYAAPPLNDLRFQAPQPSLAWSNTLNVSTDQNVACPQPMLLYNYTYPTTEDCLVLHVLTPNITGNLPVLVWIHGGGYFFGFATAMSLDGLAINLAKRNVVVVAINYRINVFGFFTTRTTEFPGNMGMLDQIQALKWIKAEIRNFGGNPDEVTIMGESSGAASVSLLTYSPLTKGLYNQAIMESGTAYNTWAWNGVHGVYNDTSQRLAIALNCSTADEWSEGKHYQKIVSCLRNISADGLVGAATGATWSFSSQFPIWSPVIGSFTPFLPKSLTELLGERQSFNAVMGNTKDEGSPTFITDFYFSPNVTISNYNETYFNNILDALFTKDAYSQNAEPFKLIARNHYIQQKFIQSDNNMAWLDASVKVVSDIFTHATVKEALILLNANAKVYLYSFDYLSKNTPWEPPTDYVSHAYDLMFQFSDFRFFEANKNDSKIVQLMGKAITNFVTTGNPNLPDKLEVEWKPISLEAPAQYFSVVPKPSMEQSFHWDAYNLYDVLFEQIKPYTNLAGGCQTTASSERQPTTSSNAQRLVSAASALFITIIIYAYCVISQSDVD